ncbi:MAG: Hsp20 family protein [Alphaproteobacteria bacterium]|nr:Hsp20 family protein [Alphaproteobacteria bacterium]
MRNFDLTPLFRSSIGFDRMWNLLDTATRLDDNNFSYPPYNIEKLSDENYQITMAVAGFSEEDLTITVKENSVIVTGKIVNKSEDDKKYLYHGIASRSFERRFELADYIRVEDANLSNGLLHIKLVREIPETAKPRTIKITADTPTKKVIEGKAA